MEMSEDDGGDIEVDTNNEYDVCSEYIGHQFLDNFEPDLEENITQEY